MAQDALRRRRAAIAQAAAQHGHARAVLALGSGGVEPDRLDAYSDLDIWIVVEDGYKPHFLDDLRWLSAVCPIGYQFQHSPNGYGLLFADGIFAEMDVFEGAELAAAVFTDAGIVWKAAGVPDSIRVPPKPPRPPERAPEARLGEALGNLYVGLGRYYRGEKLSALRFIQVYAVDQLLQLAPLLAQEHAGPRDLFSPERRWERRFPDLAGALPDLMQGYERTPQSARAILQFLDTHFGVNESIKQAILQRLAEHQAP